MKICGLQKTTLLDYPGRVAATVFTGGCNFRCPYCQNSEIICPDAEEACTEEDLLAFLKKRSGILEGVCITGGEPTIHPDLPEFLEKVKALGYLVKLDTNGFRPDVLKRLCQKSLVDYAAIDIKAGPDHYSLAAGVPGIQLEPLNETIRFLVSGALPFEFRTTAVRGIHTVEDFRQIGPWIEGCPQYFIQNFKESEYVPAEGFSGFSVPELQDFAECVRPFVGSVSLRGVDY